MVRLGLIGVGRWGRRFAETVVRRQMASPDAEITCFARAGDGKDVVIAGATQHRWEELIDRRLCDGLIVATPPDSHVAIASRAVSAGIPVLVEKPLALSADAFTPLLDAMNEAPRVPVVVDHVHLWAPAYRALKELLREEGREVTLVESTGCGVGPVRDYSSLHDYGPHDLALCFDLVGAAGGYQLESARRIQTATGELFELQLHTRGTTLRITTGNGGTEKQRRLVVHSPPRTFVYDDVRPAGEKLIVDGTPVTVDGRLPLDVVLDEFVATVCRAGTGQLTPATCRADVDLALTIARVLDEVTRIVAV